MTNLTLDADTPDTIRLSVSAATELGSRALGRLGFPDDDGRIIIAQLIDNALCGYPFASLPRILAMAQNDKVKQPRTPVLTRSKKNTKKMSNGKKMPVLLISFSKRAARAHPENPIGKWRFGGAGYPHREGKIAWHASDIVSPASRIGGR